MLGPTYIIQPSDDAKATAISVAWLLASTVEKEEGIDSLAAAKKRAD